MHADNHPQSRRRILQASGMAAAALLLRHPGRIRAQQASTVEMPTAYRGLIPLPMAIKETGTKPFKLSGAMTLRITGPADHKKDLIHLARQKFHGQFGIHLNPVDGGGHADFELQLGSEPLLTGPVWQQNEAYRLTTHTSNGAARVLAAHPHGLFNGLVTLLQLIRKPEPPGADAAWLLPAVEIHDFPRFEWRGFMLDVSRHFFDADEVMAVLDAMAGLKLNRFHWHLTDDQGWRLAIDKYPKLTELGAWRQSIGFGFKKDQSTHYNAAGQYGGFYTPGDVRRVLEFARIRHITVIPEIESPGHCSAALHAYPELGCTGKPVAIPNGSIWKTRVAYCVGNPKVFTFLSNVLEETARLFPGPYLHTGGDEVAYNNWQNCPSCLAVMKAQNLHSMPALQGYFEQRVADIVRKLGRSMVCWHDNPEFSPEGMIAMAWRGKSPTVAPAMAAAGHPVISCPQGHLYFDWLPTSTPTEKVYAFDPRLAGFTPKLRPLLWGCQANLWTEHVPNLSVVWQRTFPRLCAAAEVFWTAQHRRNWTDFSRRLAGYDTPPDRPV